MKKVLSGIIILGLFIMFGCAGGGKMAKKENMLREKLQWLESKTSEWSIERYRYEDDEQMWTITWKLVYDQDVLGVCKLTTFWDCGDYHSEDLYYFNIGDIDTDNSYIDKRAKGWVEDEFYPKDSYTIYFATVNDEDLVKEDNSITGIGYVNYLYISFDSDNKAEKFLETFGEAAELARE